MGPNLLGILLAGQEVFEGTGFIRESCLLVKKYAKAVPIGA